MAKKKKVELPSGYDYRVITKSDWKELREHVLALRAEGYQYGSAFQSGSSIAQVMYKDA